MRARRIGKALSHFAADVTPLCRRNTVDLREKDTKGMLDSEFRYRRHGRQLCRS